MKRPIIRTALLATAVAAGVLLPATAAHADPMVYEATGWCSQDGVTPPCLDGFTVYNPDGSSVDHNKPTTTDWLVGGVADASDGAVSFLWDVTAVDDAVLTPDHQFAVQVDFGKKLPRATYTRGAGVFTKRTSSFGDNDVVIWAHPTRTGLDNCDVSTVPWSCATTAADDKVVLSGQVSDYGQWEDPTQRAHLFGFDVWTNIEATDAPPTVSGAGTADSPLALSVTMANPRFWHDGTVVRGQYHMRLPKRFLQDMGVDTFDSLDPGSIQAGISSGTTKVSKTDDGIAVDATDITFPGPQAKPAQRAGVRTASAAPRFNSQRRLSVRRGDVRPGRPYSLHGSRKTRSTAAVAFHAATPHGSAITSYQARCTASHRTTRFGSATGTRVVIGSLTAGAAYRCGVRAHARAGWGPWSLHTVFVAGRP